LSEACPPDGRDGKTRTYATIKAIAVWLPLVVPYKTMHNLEVQIVRFVGSDFPGWVECEVVDAEGRRHILKDKVPIFAVEVLDADSKYPMPGTVLCEVLERYQDEQGQELARVSTEKPFYIESTEGLSEFTVPTSLITSMNE
jgi:hypothetical protein